MEILEKVGELIKKGKPLEALDVIKSVAPEDVKGVIENIFRDPEGVKSLDEEWKDIVRLVYFAYTSEYLSKHTDNQSLVSCVVSSINAAKLGIELGLKSVTPSMMRNAARALILMDMKERAERMYIEAERICEEIGDEEEISAVENDLATLYYELGKYTEARAKIDEALAIRRRSGSEELLAETLGNAAEIYVKLGEFDDAEKFYREAEEIYRKLCGRDMSVRFNLALLLSNFGIYCKKLGRYDEAEKKFSESLELLRELEKLDKSFSQFVATTLKQMGDLYREMKKYKEAEECYKQSREKFREIQRSWEMPAS